MMKIVYPPKLTVFLILTLALLPPNGYAKAGENANNQTNLDLSREFPRLPVWKGRTIKSSYDIFKLVYSKSPEIQERRLNEGALNNFPCKVMRFDFDKQDYEIYVGQRSPEVDNDQEPVGLLLGKIKLSKNDWGILVLESGFYDLTAIYLYPFSAKKGLGPGLEVADYFGDEGQEITISSTLLPGISGSNIKTIITFLDTPEDSGSTKVTKRLKKLWKYKDGSGFNF